MRIVYAEWGGTETSSSEEEAEHEETAREIAAGHLGLEPKDLLIHEEEYDGRPCWIVSRVATLDHDHEPEALAALRR